jgi:hypothetical protein
MADEAMRAAGIRLIEYLLDLVAQDLFPFTGLRTATQPLTYDDAHKIVKLYKSSDTSITRSASLYGLRTAA